MTHRQLPEPPRVMSCRRRNTAGAAGMSRPHPRATLGLAGASLVYQALALAAYALDFVPVAHLFVVLHEERALAAAFGREYERYRQQVGRWWPRA